MSFLKGGNFGLSEVDPDGNSAGGTGESLCHCNGPIIVESHAVDESFVAREAKHAWLFVSGLGVPSNRADFDESKPELVPLIQGDCVFIQASCEADSVGEGDAK
jgi:hypothetical protein